MNIRILRFALVGGIGFIADAVVFSSLFYLANLPLLYARGIAFVCAATVTWAGNRLFTFHSSEQKVLWQWLRFMCGATISALPNLSVFHTLSSVLGEAGGIPMIALVAGILAGMVSNYFLSATWVFKHVK